MLYFQQYFFRSVLFRVILFGLALLSVAGFSFAEESDKETRPASISAITAKQLLFSTQCNVTKPQATTTWLADQKDLNALYQQIHSHFVSGRQGDVPVVDFSRNAVLFVSMGQKFTGGYTVKLINESVQVKAGVATVIVKWGVPRPGAFLIQVLTSPCVLIKIPLGDYQQIDAVDQRGVKRGSVNLSEK